MSNIQAIVNDAVDGMPQVPSISVERAVLMTARDFCRRTRLLSVPAEDITTVADQAQYPISVASEEYEILYIDEIHLDGKQVYRFTEAQLKDQAPSPPFVFNLQLTQHRLPERDWRQRRDAASEGIVQESFDMLTVTPIPSQTGSLIELSVFAIPALNATDIPALLATRYHHVMVDGVKARLFRQPKKEWTDLSMASDYRADFDHGVQMAFNDKQNSYRVDDSPVGKVRAWP